MKKKIDKLFISMFSGLFGVILSLVWQYFITNSQSQEHKQIQITLNVEGEKTTYSAEDILSLNKKIAELETELSALKELKNEVNTLAILKDTLEYNGHYYKLYNLGMTWEDAKLYCESIGGHLATITSQEEQNTIECLLTSGNKNSYWIGGCKDSLDNWKWITAEIFEYAYWSSNQPDNYAGEENALMLYRILNPNITCKFGQWNDIKSDGTCADEEFFGPQNFGLICEWDFSLFNIKD